MDRRTFLRGAVCCGLTVGAGRAGASLLPASPVFGRAFDALDGASQPLAQYLGRPILMNFWASWCAPCVREMPLLESVHHQHPGLLVLGLAVDTRANVVRFLDKIKVSYPLLLTGTQGIPLMRELGNKGGGLPFTVLFDRQGHAASFVIGELKEADLQQRLQQIL
ncbi:TlpA family protein disulfide reductase [Castellaniella caeni]|uniref:TlpA family protein disulfide reductase n=1 Tax=Castellaniella caeni TaxID=266123 RepID=UPI000A00C7F2|nr:TlpA disulfide reductase family protein [Castellaniella caeni]